MKKNNVLISEGNRPWWQIIIAALAFTGALVFLYMFFTKVDLTESSKKLRSTISLLEVAIFLIINGIAFSVVRDYHFDFQNKQYKILYCLGPLQIGKWQSFKKLEYISVFKNGKDLYEVNLWYNTNKRFNISTTNNLDAAFEGGKEIAKKLAIDMVDASDPHNSKWVDV